MNKIVSNARASIIRLIADERGSQLVETAIWLGLIAAIVITTVSAIGTDVSTALTNISSRFNPT